MLKQGFIMITKKLLFIFLYGLGSLFVYGITQQMPIATIKTNRQIDQKTIDYLDSLEKQAWIKLEQCGITKEKCQNFLDNLLVKPRIEVPLSDQPIPAHVRNIIHSVLQDFNVDPATIKLQAYYYYSPAAAGHDTIFIDEKECNHYSDLVLRFIIGHEVQHIINHDYVTKYSLEELSKKSDCDKKDIEEALAYYTCFTEQRADLLTASKDKDYAQGLLEFSAACLEEDGDDEHMGYPKNSKRLLMAQNVLQLHQDRIA